MTHTTHIISLYILNIIYYNERRTNVKILFYFLEYMLLKDTLIFDTRKKYLHFIIIYSSLFFSTVHLDIPLCTSLVLYKSPFIHGITKKVTANNAVVDGIKIERRLARSFAANAILGCGGNLR